MVFAMVAQSGAAISFAITAAVLLFPAGVMRIFTNSEAVIAAAIPYLRLVCFSYVLYTLSDTMVSMLRCVENVVITMVVSLVSLVFGLFFNYALIYGRFGLPALGLEGAAAATLITRFLELAAVAVYVLKVQKTLVLRPRDLLVSNRRMWGDFIRYGGPIVAGDLQWGLVGMCKAMIVGRLGVQMIAANSVADTMMSLGLLLTGSLSVASCVIIGKAIGEGDMQRTRAYSRTIQWLFLFAAVVMASAAFLLRRPFVSLYGIEPATAQLAVTLIAVGAVTLLGTGYHAACFTGINRGGGDSGFVFKVDMICGWLVVLPLAWLSAFVLRLPMPLVYLALRIDQCFKWLIAFIRLRGDKWIHNVTRAECPSSAAGAQGVAE
jgi:putative MATE family efflux protein